MEVVTSAQKKRKIRLRKGQAFSSRTFSIFWGVVKTFEKWKEVGHSQGEEEGRAQHPSASDDAAGISGRSHGTKQSKGVELRCVDLFESRGVLIKSVEENVQSGQGNFFLE